MTILLILLVVGTTFKTDVSIEEKIRMIIFYVLGIATGAFALLSAED